MSSFWIPTTMADKILTFILCLSVTVVLSQDVTLNGNCSDNGDLQPMKVWGVQRDPLSCRLWGTSSCGNDQLPPTVGGAFMGSPESLRTEGTLVDYPGYGPIPQLVVTWEPPRQEAGFDNLKGFYLEIHRLTGQGGNEFICRVFDFSESNFTSENYKLHFQKKMVGFPGGKDHLYLLYLYTLPNSIHSVPKKRFFLLQNLDKNATANWTPAISYYIVNVTAPTQITVEFSLAPMSFGFTSYFIQLVDTEDDKNAWESCYFDVERDYQCQGQTHNKPPEGATTVSHTFYDVPAGNYKVWIQPFDPYRQEDNCLCYDKYLTVDGNTTKRNCQRCMTTETGVFTVDGDKATPPATPPTTTGTTTSTTAGTTTKSPVVTHSSSPESSTNENEYLPPEQVSSPDTGENTVVTVVAAVLGVVLGLFLVGVVVVVLLRRKRTGGFIPIFKQQPNNRPLTPTTLSKKTVYLLYASDHSEHVNVVAKLASFLKERCNCTVYFLPWYQGEIRTMGAAQWIMKHIDQSDFYLIINSEAAFNLIDARNTNTSFQVEDEGPEGDTFSMAMTHVNTKSGQPNFYKKTILAYFDYTNEEFIMKELSPGGIYYKLPKHLKELMYHIHEVDTYNMNPKELEVASMDDLDTPEGRSLQEAITKARHFQKSNKNWFRERFQRQDSAYDSIHDDNNQGDSVSSSPENFTGPPQFSRNDDDDDQQSAITYDTYYNISHLRSSPIPPSDVDTTTTEGINRGLHQVNLDSVENPAYRYDASVISSPPLDEKFYPPHNVPVDGDINEQFINISMDCYENDTEGRGYLRDDGHATQDLNNLSRGPVVSDEEENEDLEDGRDV